MIKNRGVKVFRPCRLDKWCGASPQVGLGGWALPLPLPSQVSDPAEAAPAWLLQDADPSEHRRQCMSWALCGAGPVQPKGQHQGLDQRAFMDQIQLVSCMLDSSDQEYEKSLVYIERFTLEGRPIKWNMIKQHMVQKRKIGNLYFPFLISQEQKDRTRN